METLVVRVWLPDRPGALGQVAGAIGAVGGDVVGIEILERGGGSAIDELSVALPDAALTDRLIDAIRSVEGVAVEHVRSVDPDRPDGTLAALAAVAAIAAAPSPARLEVVCQTIRQLFDADWSVALSADGATALAAAGSAPPHEWLAAFMLGSRHLASDGTSNGHEHTPGDLAWAQLPVQCVALACGRAGRVFHARERSEVDALAVIIDALAAH